MLLWIQIFLKSASTHVLLDEPHAGGVLIFHTRAVTWGLGFSCLVQFSACVVVKAIYLLLFICLVPVWWSKLYIYYYLFVSECDGVRIGKRRGSCFQLKVFPHGENYHVFPPFYWRGMITFKVEHSLKMVREKSLRIIKAQISLRSGGGIKAYSIVRFYESLIFTAKFNHDEVLN